MGNFGFLDIWIIGDGVCVDVVFVVEVVGICVV